MEGTDFSRMNFVANIGNYESPCGYCRSGNNTSLGMVANQMTCEAYQDLLNRGWRRSGTWLYRSLDEESECSCRPHTIRLDVHKFVPTRAQKQVMRRFEKYIVGAAVRTKWEPPAPSTPPLSGDVPGMHTTADSAATVDPNAALKKQQQDCTEERKRKSHLISASPPASPPAPSRVQNDATALSSVPVHIVAARMSRAISHAVQELAHEGVLPEARYAAADVRGVSAKQRRLLGPRAALTSAAAFPIAAAARRASGSGRPSAEDIAGLLAKRLEAEAREAHLQVEAELGHLNFSIQPGASCDVSSSKCSAAVGGEDSVRSMSIDSRECNTPRPSLRLSDDPGAEQQRHDALSVGQQPSPCDPDSAGISHQTLDDRQHISIGSCQTAKTPVEQPSSALLKMRNHTAASVQSCEVSRRRIHVDATCGKAGAVQEVEAPWLPAKEAGASERMEPHAGPGHLSAAEQTRPRRLEVRLVPMPANRAELAAEFPLYRRYQIMHHHEPPHEVRESTFMRFLVDTPLVRGQAPAGQDGHQPDWSFGSYHQQYWIDGELVAVAVLDVLPQCVSSVYFFWEPSLSFLSLGKVSALNEIVFVQAAAVTCPSLHYYYMGYFISSCPKMRYKADFRPSDLLCMHSLCWVPVERAVPALDKDAECIIGQLLGALEGLDAWHVGSSPEHGDYLSATALDGTLLYLNTPQGNRRLVRLGQLARMNVPQETLLLLREKLRSWRQLVGPGLHKYVHVM